MNDNSAPQAGGDPLIEMRDLKLWYRVKSGGLGGKPEFVRAVDGITLDIRRGETLGLVGESGCGKSSLGRTLMQLEKPTGGQVLFEGQDMATTRGAAALAQRRAIQMIFQDPLGSLDPRMKVRRIIGEGLVIAGVPREERVARVEALAERVGLRREHLERYPHEFSGGQRQRIGIAARSR